MRAYRHSVNLKLGLVVFAVGISVASLFYTSRFVRQLRAREAFVVQLQARAYEELARAAQLTNPHAETLVTLDSVLTMQRGFSEAQRERFREAVQWAQTMPPPGELSFINEHILLPNLFEIPAVLTETDGRPVFWRNLPIDSALAYATGPEAEAARRRARTFATRMDEEHRPVPIILQAGETTIAQQIHYGESRLVRELRAFPYVQLGFVALFVLTGYLGFSYVRRSEQSSLWAGMAKEAAHQLGTPISSLMGWAELMKTGTLGEAGQAEAVSEIEKDIARLNRVTSRFSSIGSLPRLDVQPVLPIVEAVATYLRRRIPRSKRVTLTVDVPRELRAQINADLFEWVIENLVKNALDAIEGPEGTIEITGRTERGRVLLDVRDTGKGIERRDLRHVFRPGFSTKKRGWGLGLSLARRIVEHYHGGRLRLVSSRTGPGPSGTTFRIELPEG